MSQLEENARALRKLLEIVVQDQPDEVALEMVCLHPHWNGDGCNYAAGARVQYNRELFTVLQSHISQETWTPADAPSLFAKVLMSEDGKPLPWVQPDSTNPYMEGDRVLFEDTVYESLIDNNVWSPTGYPAGWKEITE